MVDNKFTGMVSVNDSKTGATYGSVGESAATKPRTNSVFPLPRLPINAYIVPSFVFFASFAPNARVSSGLALLTCIVKDHTSISFGCITASGTIISSIEIPPRWNVF